MSAMAQPKLSVEEYLTLDRAADYKSEFYQGEMFAMAGGSVQHIRIITNAVRHLGNRLQNGRCEVFGSELRVLAGELRTYPDLTVVCGDLRFAPSEKDTVTNPRFIAEVLSPTTERMDRGLKAMQYRMVETLEEYALISQDQPRVELYTRQPEGKWLLTESVGLESVCELTSLGTSLPMTELYERVVFGEAS
jgi:Uma2 family endonuclease